MLIVCPHCQARYDFPAEQLGGEAIRVRCSACGHVARLAPDGTMVDGRSSSRGLDDDSPAQAGYAVVNRRSRPPAAVEAPSLTGPRPALMPVDSMPPDPLEGLGEEEPSEPPLALPPGAPRDPRGVRLTDLNDDPVSLPATPAPSQVSLGGRDERDVESEPSIIIDMTSIAEPANTPPPAPAAPPSPAAVRSPPPPLVVERHEVDIPVVPRRSAGKFFFSALVFGIAGVFIFIWARNDFGDIAQDPGKAAAVAFGQAQPTAPPTAAPVVVEPPPPVGALQAVGVGLVPIPKKGAGFVLRGELVNTTPVTHGAIALRAVLLRDGMPVRERTLACCEHIDLPTAQAVAANPEHPHFSTKLNNLASVQLTPGERRPFSVVFPDPAGELNPAALVPLVEVKHSEVVRAQ